MITVAVANVIESSQQALEFIYNITKTKGLKVQSISPETNILYLHNKRLPLKQYVETVEKEKDCDLLVIELSKKAMEKQLYENLKVHIAVFFDTEGSVDKKGKIRHIHVTPHMVRGIHSCYYVLPEKFKNRIAKSITYGWSKDAHLSATSAQRNVDGNLEVQCYIGDTINTINGTTLPLKEFGVASPLQNIEGVLAGIATLIIYGIDLGEYVNA